MTSYREITCAKLGRTIGTGEVVHHLNGNHSDNRPENLIVMSKSEHGKLHGSKFQGRRKHRLDGLSTLRDLEKVAILETLERVSGNRKAAAHRLGISLRTLQYRLREYGLGRSAC